MSTGWMAPLSERAQHTRPVARMIPAQSLCVRLLPICQQMTHAVVKMSVDTIESDGEAISCKAGCGACCRQAVPISEVEAYQIAELVDAMP